MPTFCGIIGGMRPAAAKDNKRKPAAARGFSLVELAIAMLIFGLIISNILGPAAELYERRKNNEAREYLARASQAIMNYAVRNRTAYRSIVYDTAPSFIPAGRPYLPCPDIDGDGLEDREAIAANVIINDTANNGGGHCTRQKGTIPWETLKLQPMSDPWKNYLTYHVDASYSNALLGFDEESRADRHDTSRTVLSTGARNTYADKTPASRGPFVICQRPAANATACTFNGNDIIGGVLSTVSTGSNRRLYAGTNFNESIVKGAAFVLVSHGKNGKYARSQANEACRGDSSGATPLSTTRGAHEYRNGYRACLNTGVAYDATRAQEFYFSYPISDHPTTGEFDDLVHWTMTEEIMGVLNNAGEMIENDSEAKSPLPITKLQFPPRL